MKKRAKKSCVTKFSLLIQHIIDIEAHTLLGIFYFCHNRCHILSSAYFLVLETVDNMIHKDLLEHTVGRMDIKEHKWRMDYNPFLGLECCTNSFYLMLNLFFNWWTWNFAVCGLTVETKMSEKKCFNFKAFWDRKSLFLTFNFQMA